jgi:hypothetical protein
VDEANKRLADRNAAIGPSHFLRKDLPEQWVYRIWEHAVLPYAEEHFFGEPNKLKDFDLDELRASRRGANEDGEGEEDDDSADVD